MLVMTNRICCFWKIDVVKRGKMQSCLVFAPPIFNFENQLMIALRVLGIVVYILSCWETQFRYWVVNSTVKNYCQVRSIGFKILIWLFFSNSFLLRAKTAVNHDTKGTRTNFGRFFTKLILLYFRTSSSAIEDTKTYSSWGKQLACLWA